MSTQATWPLLGVVLIWGLNFPVMKTGFEYAHPLTFNALRISLSVVFLALWARRERPVEIGGRHRWALCGLGLLGHFGYQVPFVLGLGMTSVGNAALLISSSPVWAALAASILGERLGGRAWAGLVVVCTGTAVIALGGGRVELSSENLAGDLTCVGAAMAWGTFTALARPYTRWIPPARFTVLTMAFALPAIWAAALLVGPTVHLAAPLIWRVGFSGLFATGVAYVLFNIGLERVGAARATGFVNLVPVVSLATGAWFLDEPILASQVLGGVLVITGLWWMQRGGVRVRGRETATDRVDSGESSSRA